MQLKILVRELLNLFIGLTALFLSLYVLSEEVKHTGSPVLQRLGQTCFSHFGGLERFQKQSLALTVTGAIAIVALLVVMLWRFKVLAIALLVALVLTIVPTYLSFRR